MEVDQATSKLIKASKKASYLVQAIQVASKFMEASMEASQAPFKFKKAS